METHESPLIQSDDWQRSSFCQNGECLEITAHNGTVVMRNSAQPGAGYARFTPDEFTILLNAAKAGRFDPIASI
jgi:hypothetical protein